MSIARKFSGLDAKEGCTHYLYHNVTPDAEIREMILQRSTISAGVAL